jgi:Tol biopolymer transport system component
MGVWNPAGSQVAYSSAKGGNMEAWITSSQGSGQPRQLTTLGGQVHVDAFSPDGRTLTLHHHRLERPAPILMLALDRDGAKPEVFLEGDFNAEGANFSPDGRYVAYLSQETGQREIYIRPYPGTGEQVTVSVGGGREPVWAKNGDLFYRSLTGERVFVVAVATEPKLRVGTPVQLFQGPFYIPPTGSPRPQYDVAADGQRLLMLTTRSSADSSPARPRIVIVQDWFEELRRLVPTS